MNILEAIDDVNLFAPWFRDPATWTAWRAFLCALFALPMSASQLEVFRACTGRATAPSVPFNEAFLVCGRRAGKSFILALTAIYLATFRNYTAHLAPGERATVLIIAADRKQARVIFRYLAALLRDVPMLAAMVERETSEAFDLTNRVTLEVGTASYRTTRGYAFPVVLVDELAFMRSEDSANPDYEILAAIKPGMASIPNAMLLCASSPYARRGALFDAHRRYFGKDDAPTLVWQAPTRTMNPTVPVRTIAEAIEADPASAAAEYMAQFRSDVEGFVTREAVEACISPGCRERQPGPWRYVAFVDPSGGSADAMTLAVAHKEGGSTAVLDALREVRPPFSPEAVVAEFSTMVKRYRASRVTGDRYAADWVASQFRKCGVAYFPSEKTKSDLYCELLPLINSRSVDLLAHDRMVSQLVGLERRVGRSGKDYVDHGPGGHDDISNVVAGALVLASSAIRGDGTEKQERVPLPSFESYYGRRFSDPINPGTGWMAGPRRY
jgi:hypothetical protein